ncbi:hypothetical protein H7I41_28220 [Mycobacterium manitobense]|uniref:DUF4352 domain-containing protein n=1 Tax=[Mycobacterium] manitobense TaxID=190147 RepID=A0A9X2YV67_9MYCO|nr:hypothetical protein [[Mycobacterium] manitobense]MCV7173816.1 hypothetical protein [[Mycobacterium] manitobense]
MKQSIAGLGVLAFVVTGCVKEEGVVLPPRSEPVATSSSVTSSAPAADPSRPQPLGTKLDLGKSGAPLEVTADEINQNSAPTIMPPGGGHWASVRVETCAKKDASGPLTVGSSEWSAADAAGVVYNASTLTEVGFPDGQFPTAATIAPGDCARGWLMFPAGFRAMLTTVTYTLNSATKATWTAPVQ